jgi:uncharacterized membrane protein
MESSPPPPARPAVSPTFLKALLILVTGLLVAGWWSLTPPGLLGKADAAGYAVCHRIDTRSFHIHGRQTPLCARCSGMYLGALFGLAYLARFGRRAGMPSLKIFVVLGVFLAVFAIDGVNSYMHFFPGLPHLYEPHNTLRLITGTGLGLGIAAVLAPVFHQTVWSDYDPRPALAGFRQLLPLVGLAALLVAVILTEAPAVLLPLALLSGAAVPLLLTLVYGVIWVLIARRENRFQRPRQLWVPLLAGFLTAMVQIAIFDAGRYWLTGTWSGFPL